MNNANPFEIDFDSHILQSEPEKRKALADRYRLTAGRRAYSF